MAELGGIERLNEMILETYAQPHGQAAVAMAAYIAFCPDVATAEDVADLLGAFPNARKRFLALVAGLKTARESNVELSKDALRAIDLSVEGKFDNGLNQSFIGRN